MNEYGRGLAKLLARYLDPADKGAPLPVALLCARSSPPPAEKSEGKGQDRQAACRFKRRSGLRPMAVWAADDGQAASLAPPSYGSLAPARLWLLQASRRRVRPR